jgi:hypothetical protein
VLPGRDGASASEINRFLFTRAEWLAHLEGKVLAGTPMIETVKIADG